jgi:tRNA (mo5U34)-methyltransferase
MSGGPGSRRASPRTRAGTGPRREPAAELGDRIGEIGWYHTQELAPGVVAPGMFDLRPYVGRYGVPEDLSGLRVLDVGTYDGFWAFEFERRGADVVALDVDRIWDLDWPPRLRPREDEARGAGFALAHQALGSSVERVALSIYDATPEDLGGRFDLVFCGSVLIHLRDPALALERMAGLCAGRFILAEEYTTRLALRFLEAAHFSGEGPHMTWWIPSVKAWCGMVRTAGFEDVREHGRFKLRFRDPASQKAHRLRDHRRYVPHVVIHART